MQRLEVGKLYCVRENPLTIRDRPYETVIIGVIDTSVPFLILDRKGPYYQVLYGDKKGWIDILPGNPAKEIR